MMMRQCLVCVVVLLGVLCLPAMVSAQFVVHDPTNYAQAITTYQQLVQQYQLLLQQARRLPVNQATRYRVPTLPWPSHGTAAAYAHPLLDALNRGDATGAQYAQTIAAVDPIQTALAQIPAGLRARIGTAYATIELADRVARSAVHQAGALRTHGATVLQTIQSMEDDAVSGDDRFHTQAALLNKINAASVLGLRIAEQTSQSLLHVVEQLLVTNKRQRDAEAKLMNAQLYQWRYGQSYAQDLFRQTAQGLDSWRQP
jgi:hypothetical protein